ncbi:tripartite motif-containing protein 10-like [Alligator mississippiensis]|uniref:tripartite motif-containing protein 10-like n=1 Tax=Alligator mississippiensis TaxID=8496 RepID=UPI0028774C4F|nr:tripartite motif-containing protein 10-like [Alligator mississippiensis]XP_059570860.1 tripartite motif-containing protein 10-like [Alligator mississippiensis]XP_059570861.1 tripartite motif-containing protein 10-like [Alligator mississippiensis]XP_059570862.1 tripartite motif-containing protein 10-like [Alligator mississippiensis]
MASPRPGQGIQEEIKCPICLEHLTDPVTLDCGHNFCRACISDYCEIWEEHGPLECPVCRAEFQKGNLCPNWQLANLVEGIKQLELVSGVEDLCMKHKKELNLFCEEDGATVCVVCERSPEHRAHSVLLIEEAAQKYKEKIQVELEILRKERKRLEDLKVSESQKHQECQTKTKAERQKVLSEFKRLHQFIEEQEQLLLDRLAELEREIEKSQQKTVSKLLEEISHLDSLISEMESKCQQPPSDLLQDIRSTLIRCKRGQFQLPLEISPELQPRLKSWSELKGGV